MAEALQQRGTDKLRADLAAQASGAVLGYALDAWFADSSVRLDDYLDRAFVELPQLSS